MAVASVGELGFGVALRDAGGDTGLPYGGPLGLLLVLPAEERSAGLLAAGPGGGFGGGASTGDG